MSKRELRLSKNEAFSVFYHDLFDYPLSSADLIRWRPGRAFTASGKTGCKTGYFFREKRDALIRKRLLKEKTSARKLEIARRASGILSFIPTVRMVAVTGSLAMMNAGKNSDIDLMIVTSRRSLWTTRLFVYLTIWLFGIQLRRPKDKYEKDRLCLNIWLDESDLAWDKHDHNIYTAHEIAQIVPLVNKNKTYEKFLWKNKWILSYWPNAVRVAELQRDKVTKSGFFASVTMYLCNLTLFTVENLAYKIQRIYMQKRVTRELVTPTRAVFHPKDWGKVVLKRLAS